MLYFFWLNTLKDRALDLLVSKPSTYDEHAVIQVHMGETPRVQHQVEDIFCFQFSMKHKARINWNLLLLSSLHSELQYILVSSTFF